MFVTISIFVGTRLGKNWIIASITYTISFIYMGIRIPYTTFPVLRTLSFIITLATVISTFYLNEIVHRKSFYHEYINKRFIHSMIIQIDFRKGSNLIRSWINFLKASIGDSQGISYYNKSSLKILDEGPISEDSLCSERDLIDIVNKLDWLKHLEQKWANWED